MIELCKNLSQIRSLFFSPAFFYWVDKNTHKEIPLECKSRKILGLRDGYSKAYKKDGSVKNGLSRQELSYGNPQNIDECILSPEAEYVIVRFSLQVTSHNQDLHSCNESAVRDALKEFASACKETGVYKELSRRYLLNIFMGRWLWMNQRTKSTEISLSDLDDDRVYVLSDVHKRRRVNDLSGFEQEYKKLTERFALALTDKYEFWDVVVEAKLKLRPFAEIFPSQTFSEANNDRSRVYSTFRSGEKEQLIFTSHKIGAAIQMIDDWHPGADSLIRVSSYGSDRENATAHRHPDTGYDVYSIMRQADELAILMNSGKKIDTVTMGKIYYLAAMMVCGGMRQVGEE
ncbi:type I-F CRISPR-associated protein Csy3 [Endozoicomonas sp. ONNA1]|uniref:type I-F CRISPR-associated protein Csy3 n=1 Tax=Endozoicomonas sp. ONNA1 TaxID=2828740 RepID=UPI00214996B8|nr:type I-F CRISPR-associated protein Csy3 [Endozoicomonas sp. ONNA1]